MDAAELILWQDRHAELVSASSPPLGQTVRIEDWTLKQVQGDEFEEP